MFSKFGTEVPYSSIMSSLFGRCYPIFTNFNLSKFGLPTCSSYFALRNAHNVMGKVKQEKWKRSKYSRYQKGKQKEVEEDVVVEDKDTHQHYELISNNDSYFVTTMISVKTNRYKNEGLMLLEGKRLIADALKFGVIPKMIIFNNPEIIKDLTIPEKYVSPKNSILYKATYKDMKIWSFLTTPPRLMGVFHIPVLSKNPILDEALPITLICDNVREPGNLGVILRIASSLPVSRVFLMKGCTRLWDHKVLRSSSGALFNLKIHLNVEWPRIEEECKDDAFILADHMIPESDETTETVRNAEIEDDDTEEAEFSDSSEEYDKEQKEEEQLTGSKLRQKYNLPVVSYYKYDCSKVKSLALVVGGETEGLSEASFRIASDRNGVRLHIPLSRFIDSLNVGSALAVIAFELKKQFVQLARHQDHSSETDFAVSELSETDCIISEPTIVSDAESSVPDPKDVDE